VSPSEEPYAGPATARRANLLRPLDWRGRRGA
jgi:hypothetical protein